MDKGKQEEHIREYYSELYKKKLDNLLGIEDFLADRGGAEHRSNDT
jgi:hypothetical protein